MIILVWLMHTRKDVSHLTLKALYPFKIMKLSKYNPNLGNLRTSDFENWFLAPFGSLPFVARTGVNVGQRPLVAEVTEDDNNYYAAFEVPGVKKESVKLDLDNRVLTVTVEKKDKSAETESSYKLTRSISVPESVNADNIGAKLEDGILTVTLPKAEKTKPRSIELS